MYRTALETRQHLAQLYKNKPDLPTEAKEVEKKEEGTKENETGTDAQTELAAQHLQFAQVSLICLMFCLRVFGNASLYVWITRF